MPTVQSRRQTSAEGKPLIPVPWFVGLTVSDAYGMTGGRREARPRTLSACTSGYIRMPGVGNDTN